MPEPEPWEVEYQTWRVRHDFANGLLKEYPKPVKQEASDSRKAEAQEAQKQFVPVPRITKADLSGDRRTMRRQLDQRVYLLLQQRVDGRDVWRFPQAQLQQGETLSATSERAMFDTVGRKYPIFFIGYAPIGWLPAPGPEGGRVFYQLAQVVDDPWPMTQLPVSAGAVDFAWLTKSEAQECVRDARLQELLERML